MNRLHAVWNFFLGVMNISSRTAGEYLFAILLGNLTLVFVGWLLNITGHMGWNFVFVFAFVAITSTVLIPWVALIVFPAGIDKRVGWIMLAEASTFLFLATFPLAAYPEAFWVGFGAVMVLSLTAYVWPSTVSWLRRFSLIYGIVVLIFAVFMAITGAPTYYEAWVAKVRHDREAGENDSAKWATVLEALPKTPYEDLSPSDKALYDEATRRIKSVSIPARIRNTGTAVAEGFQSIDLRKPFTVPWKMSLDPELLSLPAGARGSYTIRVPHVAYTVTCRNGMEANALADGLYHGEVGEFGWITINGRMTGETVTLDGSPIRADLFQPERFCAGKGGGAVSIKDAPQITLYFRPA